MMTDTEFWLKLSAVNKKAAESQIKYLLSQYGTRLPCNRFDVGNAIEFILKDLLHEFNVCSTPNEKRTDLSFDQYKKLSVKYSSTGNITMHNSNSCENKDCKFTDLLLLTPTDLYLITAQSLTDYNININDYLVNKKDSLKLQRSLLKQLNLKQYTFKIPFDIQVDKKKCLNKNCAETFYTQFKLDYQEAHQK